MSPERASYLRDVEQAFVAIRGRGFMVSPADVGIIEEWRKRGVSSQVVIRALRDAAQRYVETHPPSEPMPKSLSYFEPAIEQLISHRREMLIDDTPPPGLSPSSASTPGDVCEEDPLRKLKLAVVHAGEGQRDDRIKEILRACYRDLDAGAESEDPWSLIDTINRRLVTALAEVMVPGDRDRLWTEARAQLPSGGLMSERARGDRTDTLFHRLVRAHHGVPDLRETLR